MRQGLQMIQASAPCSAKCNFVVDNKRSPSKGHACAGLPLSVRAYTPGRACRLLFRLFVAEAGGLVGGAGECCSFLEDSTVSTNT